MLDIYAMHFSLSTIVHIADVNIYFCETVKWLLLKLLENDDIHLYCTDSRP